MPKRILSWRNVNTVAVWLGYGLGSDEVFECILGSGERNEIKQRWDFIQVQYKYKCNNLKLQRQKPRIIRYFSRKASTTRPITQPSTHNCWYHGCLKKYIKYQNLMLCLHSSSEFNTAKNKKNKTQYTKKSANCIGVIYGSYQNSSICAAKPRSTVWVCVCVIFNNENLFRLFAFLPCCLPCWFDMIYHTASLPWNRDSIYNNHSRHPVAYVRPPYVAWNRIGKLCCCTSTLQARGYAGGKANQFARRAKQKNDPPSAF